MSPSEDDATRQLDTDDISLLDVDESVELTRWERYREWSNRAVLTPLRILLTDWRAVFGLVIVAIYVAMGTVGTTILGTPEVHPQHRYVLPFTTMRFPLGTNGVGEGMLTRIVLATGPMLQMIFAGAVFASAMAAAVGTIGGYKRGTVDNVLMMITDVFMTIPGLPLIIVIAAVVQPQDPFVIGILLTVNAWAGTARILRSEVLSLRNESYVEASRTIGLSTSHIIRRDILPNVMPLVLIGFVQAGRNVIFSSVGLYFLGLLPFSAPNWGIMLQRAYNTGAALYRVDAAHWFLLPMLAIVFLSLGLTLLAQSLDRIFNPRLRAKHETSEDAEVDGESAASEKGVIVQ